MSIKTKNDISYFKFKEATDNITDTTDEREILEAIYNVFKPKDINAFAAALERTGKPRIKFILDLDFKQAGRFIDADTYRKDDEVLLMFKSLLKPRRKRWKPWSRYKVEDISIQEAEYILETWTEFLADIKFRYEYIYNPPVRASTGNENAQGSIERQAFAEHYGGYAEMTYLIAKGAVKDFKEIWSWDLDYFLFWGEYLLRKRDVENIK